MKDVTDSWVIKLHQGRMKPLNINEIIVIRDERTDLRLLNQLSTYNHNMCIAYLWDIKDPIGSTVRVLMEYTNISNYPTIFGKSLNRHNKIKFANELIEFVKNCTDVSEIISVFSDVKVAFDEQRLKKKGLYNAILSVLKFLEPQVIAQLNNTSHSEEAEAQASSNL